VGFVRGFKAFPAIGKLRPIEERRRPNHPQHYAATAIRPAIVVSDCERRLH
jgi:hypothetical protein